MPNTIIVTPDSVRAAISVSLSAANLPDAIIQMSIYEGAAIRDVKSLDPLWADRSGDDIARLNDAADLFTASRVIFAVPNITKQTFALQEGVEVEPVDINEMSRLLIALAEEQIDMVLNPSGPSTSVMPTMFGTASTSEGRRMKRIGSREVVW